MIDTSLMYAGQQSSWDKVSCPRTQTHWYWLGSNSWSSDPESCTVPLALDHMHSHGSKILASQAVLELLIKILFCINIFNNSPINWPTLYWPTEMLMQILSRMNFNCSEKKTKLGIHCRENAWFSKAKYVPSILKFDNKKKKPQFNATLQ